MRMFKLKLLKYYCQFIFGKILFEIIYSLIGNKLPKLFSSFSSQLSFSIGLTAANLYILFKSDNNLTGSYEDNSTFSIAIITQLALVWELLKLVYEVKDLTKDYIRYVCLATILLHSALNDIYPNSFDKLKKFNFGFTIQYLILNLLNIQANTIIPCTILGIIATYLTFLSIDFMFIVTCNAMYSLILLLLPIHLIFVLSLSNDEAAIFYGFLLVKIIAGIGYVVAIIYNFRKSNNNAYINNSKTMGCSINEKDGVNTSQDNYTSSNNALPLLIN